MRVSTQSTRWSIIALAALGIGITDVVSPLRRLLKKTDVHVREVEAVDLAGNVGSDHTARPIKVDLCQPRGTITGLDHERKPEVKIEPVPPQVLEFTTDVAR